MKKEKKNLVKNFKVLIADLLDNYEKYTDEERKQIKEIFQKMAELNKCLDKYDDELSESWVNYLDSYNRYFDVLDF